MLSPLYAIIDAEVLAARGCRVRAFAHEMRGAGVRLLQYRNKTGVAQDVLRDVAILHEVFAGTRTTLILNDRPDLALLSGCHGVHVGQQDLSPCDARKIVGPDSIVGVSTHTCEQVRAADAGCADYIAIGPVFATGTKLDASPVVGLEGLRKARALTRKPLVAIGGITRANAADVMVAGADSIAVISALLAPGQRPGRLAEDFLAVLG